MVKTVADGSTYTRAGMAAAGTMVIMCSAVKQKKARPVGGPVVVMVTEAIHMWASSNGVRIRSISLQPYQPT